MSAFVFYYRGWAAPASAEEMREQGRKWGAWFRKLALHGHLKDRGYPLERAGKVVRGPTKPVTDGPFIQSKDFVGGYSVIEAKTLDQAVALSMDCPNFETGGCVEIRPLLRRASRAKRARRPA